MSLPPTDPRAGEIARKKLTLMIVCSALVIGALLLLVLPVKLPLPLRLGLAFTDLVAAAAVWLVGRQYFSGK
jgi:broad specificity phosphatase PhoE